MHFLKLSLVKRLRAVGYKLELGPFWQKRYYDRNHRNTREFAVTLDYLHANPVKRGLVKAAENWRWSSFRHYALGAKRERWRLSRSGRRGTTKPARSEGLGEYSCRRLE